MYSPSTAADLGSIQSASVAANLQRPSAVRYIKLGQRGGWAADAIAQGVVPFGFRQIDHGPCAAGEWDDVRRRLG
jgi:hypothetical protein